MHSVSDASPIRAHDEFIGFSAWKSSPQEYVNEDVIEFDEILLNEGNHYDPTSSKFTCPVDIGVYYVAVTFRRFASEFLFLEVVKDSENVLSVSDPNSGDSFKTSGNSGLVTCLLGEQIWVAGNSVGNVYGVPFTPYTTFTVMLMSQAGEFWYL